MNRAGGGWISLFPPSHGPFLIWLWLRIPEPMAETWHADFLNQWQEEMYCSDPWALLELAFAPEFRGKSSCECTETNTQLKLQILLHNWTAVRGHTSNKDKTTDLKQAGECGNTPSAIALSTQHLKMTGPEPAELLMKMRLGVFLEFVYPAVQSLYDSNWILKNFEIPKPNSEQRSFPRSSLKPWIHKWEVLLLPHLLVYSFAFTGKENFRQHETYKGAIKCTLSLSPLRVFPGSQPQGHFAPWEALGSVCRKFCRSQVGDRGTAGMSWVEARDAIKRLQIPSPEPRIIQPRWKHCWVWETPP